MPAHPPILLVVEDDESSRVMYSEYLSHAGYWVLQAPTAADGLKSAHRFGPDIVVTDICLPGMDGWQFAEALKRDRRTSRTQIIAITGRALDDGLEKQARQAGIESLLIKPCLPDELLAEIERLLAHGR